MRNIRQSKPCKNGILTAITMALLCVVASCSASGLTEPPSSLDPSNDGKPGGINQTHSDRCILINGQIYCN